MSPYKPCKLFSVSHSSKLQTQHFYLRWNPQGRFWLPCKLWGLHLWHPARRKEIRCVNIKHARCKEQNVMYIFVCYLIVTAMYSVTVQFVPHLVAREKNARTDKSQQAERGWKPWRRYGVTYVSWSLMSWGRSPARVLARVLARMGEGPHPQHYLIMWSVSRDWYPAGVCHSWCIW